MYSNCMEKIRFPAKVVANNRITIPVNFVEAYGIRIGDMVDVEITLAGTETEKKRKGE